jgi:hypothetical protein
MFPEGSGPRELSVNREEGVGKDEKNDVSDL